MELPNGGTAENDSKAFIKKTESQNGGPAENAPKS